MLINEYRKQHQTDVGAEGKVVLITGANSGIGLSTAIRFAKAGAHVVMICRSRERGEAARRNIESCAAPGARVDLHLADLALLSETRAVCEGLLRAYPQIHILINNAGIHSSTLGFTAEGFERCWATNHLSPFLMTMLLLDRLKQSAPSRIINVSSQGHRFCGVDLNDLDWKKRTYRGLRSYGQSKTANLFVTWHLAEMLAGSGVSAVAQHPGSVKTRIGSNNGAVWRAINKLVMAGAKDASVSAEALYYLAMSPDVEGITGRFFNLTFQEKPHWHATYGRNRLLARNTWLLSEQQAGLVRHEVSPAASPAHTAGPHGAWVQNV